MFCSALAAQQALIGDERGVFSRKFHRMTNHSVEKLARLANMLGYNSNPNFIKASSNRAANDICGDDNLSVNARVQARGDVVKMKCKFAVLMGLPPEKCGLLETFLKTELPIEGAAVAPAGTLPIAPGSPAFLRPSTAGTPVTVEDIKKKERELESMKRQLQDQWQSPPFSASKRRRTSLDKKAHDYA